MGMIKLALCLFFVCGVAAQYQCSLNETTCATSCLWNDPNAWINCGGSFPSSANYSVLLNASSELTVSAVNANVVLNELTVAGLGVYVQLANSTITFQNCVFLGDVTFVDNSVNATSLLSVVGTSTFAADVGSETGVTFNTAVTFGSANVTGSSLVTLNEVSAATNGINVGIGATVNTNAYSNATFTNWGTLNFVYPTHQNAPVFISLQNYGTASLNIVPLIQGSVVTYLNSTLTIDNTNTQFVGNNSGLTCGGAVVVDEGLLYFSNSSFLSSGSTCNLQGLGQLGFDSTATFTATGGIFSVSTINAFQFNLTNVVLSTDFTVSSTNRNATQVMSSVNGQVSLQSVTVNPNTSLTFSNAQVSGGSVWNYGTLSAYANLTSTVYNYALIDGAQMNIANLYLDPNGTVILNIDTDSGPSDFILVTNTSQLGGNLLFNISSALSGSLPYVFAQQSGTLMGAFASINIASGSVAQWCSVATLLPSSNSTTSAGYIYHVGVTAVCRSSWSVVAIIASIAVVTPIIFTGLMMFYGLYRSKPDGYQSING